MKRSILVVLIAAFLLTLILFCSRGGPISAIIAALMQKEKKKGPASAVPTADFSAAPITGTAPLSVNFTDTSTGSVTSRAWDFENDGTTDSTEQNPVHTYTVDATHYSVRLTVTGPGGSDTETKFNYITVGTPPFYRWTRRFGGTDHDGARALCADGNGNVYVAGYFWRASVNFAEDFGGTDTKTNAGGDDAFVTKINSDGSYGWTRRFGETALDRAFALCADGSGNVYIAGWFYSASVNFAADFGGTDTKTNAGGYDAFVTKIEP